MPPIALTIAGSDPSGGAGIQADLKTFHQFGVYGEAVITLVTVQNTRGVSRVERIAPDLVRDQILALLDDLPPHAIKTGALGSASIIEGVAAIAPQFRVPIVVDPVIISKNGTPLLDAHGVNALRRTLLPLAFLVTPNLAEAAVLAGRVVATLDQMFDAARAIADLGARNVLVKGGHLEGDAIDVLLIDGEIEPFPAPRIETRHTHGTGCVLSAAITALIAKGRPLADAVHLAKQFVSAAIENSPQFGAGNGPLDFWANAT